MVHAYLEISPHLVTCKSSGPNAFAVGSKREHSFQDESQAEEGFVFENLLWGGELSYATTENGMDKDDGFPATVNVTLKSWPRAKPHPRPARAGADNSRWPDRLTEPPASTVNRETALPVTTYSRLFHESFWARGGPFAQYGHQALRMPVHQWEGRPLKSQFEFLYVRNHDSSRAFGSKAAVNWMLSAYALLREAGQYAIAEYMLHLTESLVEGSRMGKRLHYEKKTWAQTDPRILGRIGEIRRLGNQLPTLLANYRQARDQPGDPRQGPAPVANALSAYIDQGRLMLVEATELERLLGIEVQQTQYLILGVLKQIDETRRSLGRYLDILRYRLQNVLGRRADEAIAAVSALHQQYLAEIVPGLPQPMDGNQQHRRLSQLVSAYTTMSASIQASFPSVRNQLNDLVNTISICLNQDGNGALARPPLDRFNYLLDSSGIRQMRTERRNLEGLAIRDIRRLPEGSQERRIVYGWMMALATQPQVAGAATGPERQALSDYVLNNLMDLF